MAQGAVSLPIRKGLARSLSLSIASLLRATSPLLAFLPLVRSSDRVEGALHVPDAPSPAEPRASLAGFSPLAEVFLCRSPGRDRLARFFALSTARCPRLFLERAGVPFLHPARRLPPPVPLPPPPAPLGVPARTFGPATRGDHASAAAAVGPSSSLPLRFCSRA